MSQSSAAEGLERGEPKALECFCSFVQSNCKYIQAGHNPSEVTGKDGMIYQTGRQAGRLQAVSCYCLEQRGVRESERAQNRESDKVIGFLATSHSCPALWLARCTPAAL